MATPWYITPGCMQRYSEAAAAYLDAFGDAPSLQMLIRRGHTVDEVIEMIRQAIAERKPLDLPAVPLDADL